jgi:hypothetical protein
MASNHYGRDTNHNKEVRRASGSSMIHSSSRDATNDNGSTGGDSRNAALMLKRPYEVFYADEHNGANKRQKQPSWPQSGQSRRRRNGDDHEDDGNESVGSETGSASSTDAGDGDVSLRSRRAKRAAQAEHSDLKENTPELLPAAKPSTDKVYNAIRQVINEEISFYHATARHLTQTIKDTMMGLSRMIQVLASPQPADRRSSCSEVEKLCQQLLDLATQLRSIPGHWDGIGELLDSELHYLSTKRQETRRRQAGGGGGFSPADASRKPARARARVTSAGSHDSGRRGGGSGGFLPSNAPGNPARVQDGDAPAGGHDSGRRGSVSGDFLPANALGNSARVQDGDAPAGGHASGQRGGRSGRPLANDAGTSAVVPDGDASARGPDGRQRGHPPRGASPAEAHSQRDVALPSPASYGVVYSYMQELANAECSSSSNQPAVVIVNLAHATPQNFDRLEFGAVPSSNASTKFLFPVLWERRWCLIEFVRSESLLNLCTISKNKAIWSFAVNLVSCYVKKVLGFGGKIRYSKEDSDPAAANWEASTYVCWRAAVFLRPASRQPGMAEFLQEFNPYARQLLTHR